MSGSWIHWVPARIYMFQLNPIQRFLYNIVVYLDQRMGAAHLVCWSKYFFSTFSPHFRMNNKIIDKDIPSGSLPSHFVTLSLTNNKCHFTINNMRQNTLNLTELLFIL